MKASRMMALAVLCSSAVIGAASAGEGAFQKTSEKASFIHGDNLITGAMPDPGPAITARRQTPRQKAEGLSAVMVTRDGDVYESNMNPEDVALLEEAIRAMEILGRGSTTVPGAEPTAPMQLIGGGDIRVSPSSVIGADGRIQVTNTVASPYWNIGRIGIGCTGTLITAKHVLTAGHCVSDGSGNWYSSLDFTPGQNGSYKPWGTTSWARAVTTSAWHNNRNTNYDYALIVLTEPAHGGHAGYGTYSGGTHTITGYPADKPFGTMWRMSGSVSTSGSYRLCYTIDTYGGNSGSGIYDSGNVVRGVHTTGSSTQNCGTRLTSTVFNQLQSWISTYP